MTVFTAILLGGIPGAFMTFIGIGHFWNYIRLRRNDPVPIRRIQSPSGSIELEGTARLHEDFSRSPFTNTQCPVHEWKVEERKAEHHSSETSNLGTWSRLDSGDERHPFRVEDDTGIALIDVAGASPYLQTTTTIEVEPDESPPPAIDQYLQSTDEVDREHTRPRRYSESRIDPGAPVHVYGPARKSNPEGPTLEFVDAVIGAHDPDREFTLRPSTLIDRFQSGPQQFIISNAGEEEAERKMLSIGVIFSCLGLLFLGIPALMMIV